MPSPRRRRPALQREAEALKREAEAHEQQAATAEILRVISTSPADVQPVFDSIVKSGTTLCNAAWGAVVGFDGQWMTLLAQHNMTPSELETLRGIYPRLPTRVFATGRALVDRRTVHIPDIREDPEYQSPFQQVLGFRAVLAVPMLHDGKPIGVLALWRREVRPFTNQQIALVEIFAAQAVIAIENVRLFNETKESLQQQTATAEILRVISSSPTDIQPVLQAVTENASRLCRAANVSLYRVEGDLMRKVAEHEEGLQLTSLRVGETRPITRTSVSGRAIIDRAVIHVRENQSPEAALEFPDGARRDTGIRTTIGFPLLREGSAIGAFTVYRTEHRPFTEGEIALLQTFADQAVIAIENVRLFKELEARNRDLTEALDQQTGTSEILRVIASSPTDLQPVLDAVAERAARLCSAADAIIYSVDGDVRRQVAHFGSIPRPLSAEVRLSQGTATGRAILDRRTIHIPDVFEELARGEYPETRRRERGLTSRTLLITPLLREDVALGAITIRRTEMRPFSERQIALVETFADQAVIAIENVRLFKELEARNRDLTEALEQQTATSEILRVISRSQTDVQPVFDTIVKSAARLCDGVFGTLVSFDGELLRLVATHNFTPTALDVAHRIWPAAPSRATVMGRAILERSVIHVPDVELDREYGHPELPRAAGWRSVLAVPMLRDGAPLGAIAVGRAEPGPFSDNQTALLKTFADQAVIAIENVRLFKELEASNREIAEKSRQLEVASQHKSEFLANMSHELRTPLNAIIGFSEVLSERMFGELNEKQEEYSKDIHASGQHLLSLINDILDLSKIEAGRMELELTDLDLPQAIDNALILVRERAARRAITLEHSVDERLGEIRGDERKVKQVLLNLLSNALKFTPEGGRVEVRAGMMDGMAEISVTDTGVGIAPEDQGAIFKEFRQVGTSAAKQEGTGLGLALCRKFVELHGGRIWVQSEVGRGSTFTFTIPVRRGE